MPNAPTSANVRRDIGTDAAVDVDVVVDVGALLADE